MKVTFFGVRGSTPCSSESQNRYGGNTSCVVVDVPGTDPIVFDLGTGLRTWGASLGTKVPFHGHALVSHMHWDHVQGLPFFGPILAAGSTLDVYGPGHDADAVSDEFNQFLRPPCFPVRLADLPGELTFHSVNDSEFVIGEATITSRSVPHVGETNGYRIDHGGVSVVYISDHQQPIDGSLTISDSVLALCEGADLLIHDAQFTWPEFDAKSSWGHCTVDFAVAVAAQSGARQLAMFHHDPSHDDDQIDAMLQTTRDLARGTGIEAVFAASEGLSLSVGAAKVRAR